MNTKTKFFTEKSSSPLCTCSCNTVITALVTGSLPLDLFYTGDLLYEIVQIPVAFSGKMQLFVVVFKSGCPSFVCLKFFFLFVVLGDSAIVYTKNIILDLNKRYVGVTKAETKDKCC